MKRVSGLLVRALGAALVCGGWGAASARAAVWTEDFSSVGEWVVSFDPGGGSTVTSDGALGHFYVDGPGTSAVFIPIASPATLTDFDPLAADSYELRLSVASVTWSVSYMVALDLFGASENYLGTVWDVIPNTAATGFQSVNLGGFSYAPGTTYVTPKLTVFTGDGGQTVSFDTLEFEVLPEPSVALLLAGGLGAIWLLRRGRGFTAAA